jgi:hypothetical protein
MGKPPDQKGNFGLKEARADLGPTSEVKLGLRERAARLREAVEASGGAAAVSRASDTAPSTLQRYLDGFDPKFSRIIAIADACGVRLEWLATGNGPMRSGDAPAGAPPGQDMDLESLAAALDIVEKLTPDAPVEARAQAALLAHEELRRVTMPGFPPAAIDPKDFAFCLGFAEQLNNLGERRPRWSARKRMVIALGAYRTMRESEAEPDSP